MDKSTIAISRVPFRNRLEDKLVSPLARNTLWALGGYGTRLLIQAAYFIIIARCLGPEQYGGFIAATAFANVLSPFVGLGSGNLLVKNVARDRRRFSEYWGNGLMVTVVSGSALTFFVMVLCRLVLPRAIPTLAITLVCLSDLIFVRVLDLAGWAFQGFERLSVNARLNVLISLTRLFGIAGLALAIPHATLRAWSVVYLAGSVAAALIAVIWVTSSLGRPKLALHRIPREGTEGFYFSISLSAMTIYNDIDKTMVARLATLEAAGIYAAAYRLIDVVFIPVRALLSATYPGFFRSGAAGLRGSLQYGRRMLVRAIPYPLFTFGAVWIGAPLVPHILGHEYANVTVALRWLAILPVLKTLHLFIGDSLTGAGYQRERTFLQVGVAVFNVLANLWVIPAYGWLGAAWSSIASDGLLALSLWYLVTRMGRGFDLGIAGAADVPAASGGF